MSRNMSLRGSYAAGSGQGVQRVRLLNGHRISADMQNAENSFRWSFAFGQIRNLSSSPYTHSSAVRPFVCQS
jgi:hypothetical protein